MVKTDLYTNFQVPTDFSLGTFCTEAHWTCSLNSYPWYRFILFFFSGLSIFYLTKLMHTTYPLPAENTNFVFTYMASSIPPFRFMDSIQFREIFWDFLLLQGSISNLPVIMPMVHNGILYHILCQSSNRYNIFKRINFIA